MRAGRDSQEMRGQGQKRQGRESPWDGQRETAQIT